MDNTQLLPVDQTREQKLEEVVREFMVLIENRELVRNIQADHQDDWMLRMTSFTQQQEPEISCSVHCMLAEKELES